MNKMDSSNNSCNYNNTILSFQENDIINNPTSYSLFNFPNSPQYSNMEYESLYLNQIYHHLLSDQQTPPEENPTKFTPKSIRTSKKDRHSKINTARGPRDRRMRLSLDVARKFFDLQDMLGYDKASRTVDWLLKNSSIAISDLERGRNMGANYGSSTNSESCEQEVVSSVIDNLSDVWENGKNEERSSAKQVKKKVKKERKVLARPIVEKESRKRARERARVRASQKRRLLSGTVDDQQKPCGEKSEERLMVVKSRERDEIFDESMSFEIPWNYSSTHENGISHQQHLGEFQFCGKPWEAQNSCN